jgi:hypothetical protein
VSNERDERTHAPPPPQPSPHATVEPIHHSQRLVVEEGVVHSAATPVKAVERQLSFSQRGSPLVSAHTPLSDQSQGRLSPDQSPPLRVPFTAQQWPHHSTARRAVSTLSPGTTRTRRSWCRCDAEPGTRIASRVSCWCSVGVAVRTSGHV